ncbi:beta-lactamase [Coleofasciculus chthonoplastes PCC 7420]|uniref:Beta-lactamase n=1 Tax=Coleofasciculus chthonoplastes PCC 7420 TaxID=118168 RepID=B4W310_9CYAN|nr:serine hydrolase domain-containing protein [Coleofasciculus chthonoplastes]EDX71366.1 beta-lactamase [Coleofasciculus chthonoplastes PCC 7420]
MSLPMLRRKGRFWRGQQMDSRRCPRFLKKRRLTQPLLWLVVLCVGAFLLTAQSGTMAATDDLNQAVQAVLEDAQQQYGFPGATAAYVLPDGTVGVAATGVADLEAGTPMTGRSRMLAASIGKTFVGATAIALDQENVLDLDAPIAQWLSEKAWFSRLPNHQNITLRQLLTHSSGLPDHVYSESFAAAVSQHWQEPGNPFPPESLIEFVLDQPPLFAAGACWAYTDTGYILAGLVIEAATGRDYYDELQDRFLHPLELTQTSPSNRRCLPDLAAGYMAIDNPFGLPSKTTTADGVLAWHPGFEWTGGGLVSTSADLARWGAALFGGNAMSGSYLNDLLNAVSISPDGDIQYGSGVGIYRTSPFGPIYGHGGWIPGYSSSLRYYPDHDVAIAFQINTDIGIVDDTTPVVQDIEQRLIETVLSVE